MNHNPQAWGRPRDDVYGAYNSQYLPQHHGGPSAHPTTHTQSPIVTGTSVIAIKYSTGVVIAADNLASYGSLARFTDVKRLKPFNRKAVVGFGGDVSDMQYLDRLLSSLDVQENYSHNNDDPEDTKALMSAKNLHTYLAKVMYKRRSDFNPLWNSLLICGLDEKNKPFLATADLLGTTYSAPTLATGFGAHLAQPLLRKAVPDEEASQKLDKETAVEVVRECMKVLFYRDARSMNEYSIAVVDEKGVELKEKEKLENQSWAFADQIRGYGTQTV
ncbi:hypothetical protein LTR36_009603 [Oleoguttula mirabilis]|uniref:Proteasome subunit beta n=1 Tax=Oleoguttula mirabilis TaxID=1507867 RepID=A0AAV9J6H3_9PEZI|nr:hypothetical protein LTR36_009603 [Oleoguttula mirabilis]